MDNRCILKDFFINKDGSLKRGRCSESWVKANQDSIYKSLLLETSFLPQGTIFQERLYCITHGIIKRSTCLCGNFVEFTKYLNRYKLYCSTKCIYYTTTRMEKHKNTIKLKYGVDNISQLACVKEKKKQTCLKKYGVSNPKKIHYTKEVLELLQDEEVYKKTLYKLHHLEKKSILEISKLLGISDTLVGKDLLKLNIEKLRFYSSMEEKEVYSFIDSLLGDSSLLKGNYRGLLSNNKEVDIYIPSKKIAIEYNGLFWHSFDRQETVKEKQYHQRKSMECRQLGVKLFTIFENEWKSPQKQKIWKSVLRHNVKGASVRVFARKCAIKLIPYKEFASFCDHNHIQGACKSSIYLGAFNGSNLTSVMSFKLYKQGYAELTRFCCLLGTQVVGIASKFFKWFLTAYSLDYNTVITYADLRYSHGDLYTKLGFLEQHTSLPSYYYCKDKNIYHRWNFQKKHLANTLGEDYQANLSESENIFRHTTFRRIWDCGKIKFIYVK